MKPVGAGLRLTGVKTLGAAALMLVFVAGCASRVPAADPAPATSPPQSAAPASSSPAGAVSAASNRTQTDAEAGRLLALAEVPPGATPIESVPEALSGPAMGTPATSSLIDHARYWQVSMSFADALAWVKAHPPLGLASEGSSSGGGPGEQSAGFGYLAADSPAWTGATMEIGVGSVSADVTDIRADGVAEWFDPVPLRDTATGPRIRVTIAAGCPGSDADDVGVRNDATDLDVRLLPVAAPTGGLTCEYNGLNGKQFGLLKSTPLGADAAGQLADSVNRSTLSHLDSVETSCPMDDGSTTVVVMSYPGRADVDLWYARTGCESVSNGVITGSPSDALAEMGNPVTSGSPVAAAVSSN